MNETLTPAQKAAETRRRKAEMRKKSWMEEVRDHQLIGDSCRRVLESHDSTDADRLRAAELLAALYGIKIPEKHTENGGGLR